MIVSGYRHRAAGLLRRPHGPWQRGTDKNTNGLLRQYFPNGTDLLRWDTDELAAVALARNNRPRKTSVGRHPPKPSTNIYSWSKKPVLRGPLEPGECASEAFRQLCGRWGVVQPMGRVGSGCLGQRRRGVEVHSVLKVEYVHRHTFATRTEARLK